LVFNNGELIMILGGRPLQDLTLYDFETLVQNHIPEGPSLEYKQFCYADNAESIREMLRDITAMANAGGGYIIIGIRDDGHDRAAEIVPMPSPREKVQAIRQRCLEGIADRIRNFDVQAYECGDNTGIIAIHIPPSDKRPHMVIRDRRTDFVLRHGTDKFNMTMDEIRHAFLTNPLFRQQTEYELLDSGKYVRNRPIQRSAEAGPPYARIFTEGAVNQFLQKYMTYQTFPQVLVIVSPFISNLAGELYELPDIIAHINKTQTPTYVITRELKDDYQKESIALLSQSPNVEIRYNERIHAKLYICWCKEKEEDSFALFGSGNLTSGGLQNNLELGMMIYSRDHGQVLVRDLYDWSTVALRSQSRRVSQITLTPPMRRK